MEIKTEGEERKLAYPTLTKEDWQQIKESIEKDIEENGRFTCSYCYTRYKVETPIKDICQKCLETCFAAYGAKAQGCAFCENLNYDEDCDDMGHTKAAWFECLKMPQYQGLITFPFKNTPKKCHEEGCFIPREVKHRQCT